MARYERFTFLCDKDERALIARLAARLRRSQSDAVRFLVVEAARELAEQNHAAGNAVQQAGVMQNATAG